MRFSAHRLPASTTTLEVDTSQNSRKLNHFVRVWLLTMAVAFAGVAGINWLINPYGIYRGSPTVNGFNQIKPEKANRDRLVKAIDIIQKQPQHLFIGSSRTKQGINPDHEAIEVDAYNASLNAVSSYELRRYVEHAIATQPDLEKVTIGIDFFMFNQVANIPVPETTAQPFFNPFEREPNGNAQSGFAEYRLERSHLSPKDILATTFSIDAIVSSHETVLASRQSPQATPENENGFAPHPTATDNNTKSRFQHDLSIYFSRHSKFVLAPDTLTDFTKIVQTAKEAGVKLTVFISPSHAVQWEAIAQTGEWETFEAWKKALVAITPVWDFSGYSSVTTEPVRAGMDYYRDNSHYRPIVGDWVLSRLFGSEAEQQSVPDDFGVLLTAENIDSHLATVRQGRQRWRIANASTLNWVSDIRNQALSTPSETSASASNAETGRPN